MTPLTSAQLLTPQWDVPAHVHACFTLRQGGVSLAPFHSLNLGVHVGDDPAHVEENRRRVRAALALPAEPLWLDQVHGAAVLDADVPTQLATGSDGRPRADAVITRRAGVVCAIQVADCLPVLFAARDGSVIGAAHAGWRGLAAGVLENTVRALALPGTALRAWLGPAIGPRQFEVGDEVRAAFMAQDPDASSAFVANERGRWLCDLRALALARLTALGLARETVYGDAGCTVSDPQHYFSHRRDGRSGRMAALLWLAQPT